MSDSKSTIPEGFRVIPGYPRYAIDENGTVLSVCSYNRKSKDKLWANATRLKPGKDSSFYHFVVLSCDGQRRHMAVHKLVLLTFVGPCPNGMQCRHLDGNKTNNHVLNLEWGTSAENNKDKILHGTTNQGEKCPRSKLTSDDVVEIRTRYSNGETQRVLANDFAVIQANISSIVLRRTWKHI